MRPGAWKGLVVTTDGETECNFFTKERWKIVQGKMWWLAKHVDLSDEYSLSKLRKITEDKGQAPPEKIHF